MALDQEPVASGRVSTVCCRKGPDGSLESIEIPAHIRAKLEGAAV